MTVYNSNIALVRDVRRVTLPGGVTDLRLLDIAATVNPATVHVRSLTEPSRLGVLEQNYQFDLLNPDRLLRKYVGRDVKLLRRYDENGTTREREVTARLLAYNEAPVWQIDGEIVTGLHADQLRFPEIPPNLHSRPTLVWRLDNTGAAQHRLETSYLAGEIGLSRDLLTDRLGPDHRPRRGGRRRDHRLLCPAATGSVHCGGPRRHVPDADPGGDGRRAARRVPGWTRSTRATRPPTCAPRSPGRTGGSALRPPGCSACSACTPAPTSTPRPRRAWPATRPSPAHWPSWPAPTWSPSRRRAGTPCTTCSARTWPSWSQTHENEAERQDALRPDARPYVRTAQAAASLLSPRREAVAPPSPTRRLRRRDRGVDMVHGRATGPAPGRRRRGRRRARRARMPAGLDRQRAAGSRAGDGRNARVCSGSRSRPRRRSGDRRWPARIHRDLTITLALQDEFDESLSHANRALALDAEFGDESGQARTHSAMCLLMERWDRYPEALEHAQQSLELFLRTDNQTAQAYAYNTLGWYQSLVGSYQEAAANCRRAVDRLGALGDRGGEATAWDSLDTLSTISEITPRRSGATYAPSTCCGRWATGTSRPARSTISGTPTMPSGSTRTPASPGSGVCPFWMRCSRQRVPRSKPNWPRSGPGMAAGREGVARLTPRPLSART